MENETRLLFKGKAKNFKECYEAYVWVFEKTAKMEKIFEEFRKVNENSSLQMWQ